MRDHRNMGAGRPEGENLEDPRGWLLIASADRQYAGNEGYDDDPSRYYSWDDQVPNHEAIQVGDRLEIWNKKWLLGVSVVHAIQHGRGLKTLRRCPRCDHSTIKGRTTKSPRFRCQRCQAEFEEPAEETIDVTTYRAVHEASWVELYGLLDGPALRALCVSPGSQHAMRAVFWDKLIMAMDEVQPGTSRRISNMAPHWRGAPAIPGGHTTTIVRVRRGQGIFRRRLVEEQGSNCAFAGPTPEDALEAAHLYSYAAEERHEVGGGLLLRRDLHRPFDLGEIAVNPTTMKLDVNAEVRRYALYGSLHGASLPRTTLDHMSGSRRDWLARHWTQHR